MPLETVATLIVTRGPVVTCDADPEAQPCPATGDSLRVIGVRDGGAIALDGGRIVAVGEESALRARYAPAEVVDVGTRLITPGLVDPHTHPVFAATREREFAQRLAGVSYQAIAAAGGGIVNSARALQAMPARALRSRTSDVFDRLLAHGTTTIEAKSGYGLTVESELRSLEVLRDLRETHPLEAVPTVLALHALPPEARDDRAAYVRRMIDELLPRVSEAGLAEFCDVFCDEGAFTAAESLAALDAARAHGLTPRMHTDEFADIGGTEVAREVGAISADHLHVITNTGIAALVAGDVIPVLLPGTAFFLGLADHAPARRMIEAGLPIALATDFNPGSSYIASLPFIMSLACLQMGLSPEEALTACTVNAAFAVARGERLGRLRAGFQADIAIWNLDSYAGLTYAVAQNLVHAVYKRGVRVVGDAADVSVRTT